MQNFFSRAYRPSLFAALTWIALTWISMGEPAQADTQKLTTVMYFDGIGPQGGMTWDGSGNFYGAASGSSYAPGGLLYKLSGSSDTYSIANIYQFGRLGVWNGAGPSAPLLLRSDNFLYGVTTLDSIDTLRNSTSGTGTIFKVSTDGQTFAKLFKFDDFVRDSRGYLINAYGAIPRAALTEGVDGGVTYLYGTTFQGGSNGTGTIFRIRTDGTGFLVLANFGEITIKDGTDTNGNPIKVPDTNTDGRLKNADGVNPDQRLLFGGDGFLYGVTTSGGAYGTGIVYRVPVAGGAISVLHQFSDIVPGVVSAPDPTTGATTTGPATNSDGAYPLGGLTKASNGLLYGTTSGLGTAGLGGVFSITTSGTFSVKRAFAYTDGAGPSGNLLVTSDGIVGTTQGGGTLPIDPATGVTALGTPGGTVYKLSLDGAIYSQECVFNAADPDGRATPGSGVIQVADGSYLGLAAGGYGYGLVFKCGGAAPTTALGIRPEYDSGGALSWWLVAGLALLLTMQVIRGKRLIKSR